MEQLDDNFKISDKQLLILIEKLGQRLIVIGIAWNNNVKQIGSNLN